MSCFHFVSTNKADVWIEILVITFLHCFQSLPTVQVFQKKRGREKKKKFGGEDQLHQYFLFHLLHTSCYMFNILQVSNIWEIIFGRKVLFKKGKKRVCLLTIGRVQYVTYRNNVSVVQLKSQLLLLSKYDDYLLKLQTTKHCIDIPSSTFVLTP